MKNFMKPLALTLALSTLALGMPVVSLANGTGTLLTGAAAAGTYFLLSNGQRHRKAKDHDIYYNHGLGRFMIDGQHYKCRIENGNKECYRWDNGNHWSKVPND